MKQKILNEYFGYSSLKKEQEEIIDIVLSGDDCVGVLPTGFGKSVIFQVPALILEGITIVITPLIALMQDQVNNLKNKGIKAEYINSLQDTCTQDNIYNKLINNKIKILYVSAERLKSIRFLNAIKRINVSLIVCDEAHTILWSEDFRLALGHIPKFINELGYRPTHLALTATATNKTIDKINKYLKLSKPKVISCDCDRKNIFYKVIKTSNKLNSLIGYVSKHKNELGIIYCLTIRSCIRVYEYLKNFNFKVGVYYGTMEANDKLIMQKSFTNKAIDIMVCTNAFGMGIDIPNIRYVLLYEMPLCIEDYAQQIGRASRDGEYAESILFFDTNDIKTANYFIDNIENIEKSSSELKMIKKDKYYKLDKMIEFCLTSKCLHQYVVKYFNQRHNGKCMMCSNCKK